MNHMNQDHSPSLNHYLAFYGQIRNPVEAKITAFTTEKMVIDYGKVNKRKQYSMKFDPPMLAGQARHRLADIHHEARTGLGLSPGKFKASFV